MSKQNTFNGQRDSRGGVSPVQHFERQEKFVYWRRFDSISLAGVSEVSSSQGWFGWNHFALHCPLVCYEGDGYLTEDTAI